MLLEVLADQGLDGDADGAQEFDLSGDAPQVLPAPMYHGIWAASLPFVARKSPDAWRTFWLAGDSRQGAPVQLGAEVSTADERFEAILSERGMAFSQASTQRFYDRPGLAFIPVNDIPPTMLSIAWRTDVHSPVVRDFVETAKAVASLSPIPDAWVPSRFSREEAPAGKPAALQVVSPLRQAQ